MTSICYRKNIFTIFLDVSTKTLRFLVISLLLAKMVNTKESTEIHIVWLRCHRMFSEIFLIFTLLIRFDVVVDCVQLLLQRVHDTYDEQIGNKKRTFPSFKIQLAITLYFILYYKLVCYVLMGFNASIFDADFFCFECLVYSISVSACWRYLLESVETMSNCRNHYQRERELTNDKIIITTMLSDTIHASPLNHFLNILKPFSPCLIVNLL